MKWDNIGIRNNCPSADRNSCAPPVNTLATVALWSRFFRFALSWFDGCLFLIKWPRSKSSSFRSSIDLPRAPTRISGDRPQRRS